MILVGYHSTGGYKLFDVVNMRIVISRNVIIDEMKQLKQGVTGYQQSIIGYMQAITDYQNSVTGYRYEILDSEVAGSIEQHVVEARDEANVRRSTRQRGLSQRLQDCKLFHDNKVNDDDDDFIHFVLMSKSELVNVEEALSDTKWICAMKEELESIQKNNTWELVDLPKGKKAIGVKWVFKVKVNPKGEIIKHRARLMAKGFLH